MSEKLKVPGHTPRTAALKLNGELLLHWDVANNLMVKLQTVQTEVGEALAAMHSALDHLPATDPESYTRNYIQLDLSEPVIEAILSLASKNRLSRNLFAHDLMSLSARAALQRITHELTKADDGLGHAVIDSTTDQLIQEHLGAENHDRHEQMLDQAIKNFKPNPEEQSE